MKHGHAFTTMMLLLAAAATVGLFTPRARATPQAVGDFDNDGIDDLVIGVEGKSIGAVTAAGEVQVIFGTNNGLRFSNDFVLNRNSGGPGTAEAGDRFGRVVAVGDFDGDGFADLVVGAPLQDVSGAANAGAVHVYYGSKAGPDPGDHEVWVENSTGLGGTPDVNEFFGAALAVGDFNNDGFDDLAIGVPGESLSDVQPRAGVVYVIPGSALGLVGASSELWSQNSPSILDVPEANDRFGAALAAGDFNGDGNSDLAIGAPGESINTIANAGAVNVIFGSSLGLTTVNNQFWSQNSTSIEDVAEAGDHFGQSLAAGDFDGDGRDDLAIGVPDERVDGIVHAGAVAVLHGSVGGLSSPGDQFWSQNSTGIMGACNANDEFGFSLATGDFDGDGRVDLAIGVPNEKVGSADGAGAVAVLYGTALGLSAVGNQLWSQDSGGIKDVAEAGEAFGEALCTGDFNGDGFADLVVGIPMQDVGAQSAAGAIAVIYGSGSGLRPAGNQFITRNTQNAEGVAKSGDRFGGQHLDLF